MIRILKNNKAVRILFILIAIIVVEFAWWNASTLYKPLHLESASLRMVVRYLICGIPMLVFLLCLHKKNDIVSSLGLSDNIVKGIGFAALCCAPLLIGMPIIGSFNTNLSFDWFLRMVVIAAVFEEIVYRGFMFGLLFRYGKIGFLWAILLPAIFFGIGHLYQGDSLVESLMAFGVTALGALYFSWVYVECNYNLWVPIGLHIFMNFSWIVFPVEGNETSVGVLLPNILRVGSIILTIILIVITKKKQNHRIFTYPVISF